MAAGDDTTEWTSWGLGDHIDKETRCGSHEAGCDITLWVRNNVESQGAPVDAIITLSSETLARAWDDAAALAGIPLCANVDVTLVYETGETEDFTLDERTFYDDAGADPFNLFELQTVEGADGEVSAIQVCTTGPANWGAFALIVSFSHAPDLGDFIVPVNIVQAAGLSLDAHPWPTYAGSGEISKTTFDQLENTDQYEQGVLSATLELSDDSSVDVSNHASTTYQLTPSDGVFSVTPPNLLTASGAGSAQATATFADQVSSPVDFTAQATGN
jgi:hypothetical protein